MIHTLTGPNNFLLQKRLHEEVSEFVGKYGDLAVERQDGQEASINTISESLNSSGFLSTNKLVVLRAPSANKQFTEQAKDLLGQVADTTEVIIIEPKLDKRSAYAKWLQKNTEFVNFTDLDENQLTKWLVELAKEWDANLSMSDARYLINRAGTNQELLFHELEKLVLHGKSISHDDIEVMVEPLPQSTIFELLDAAFDGNITKALKLYQEQRALKVEPQQIMAMLAWQLHVLALVKTAGDKSSNQISTDSHIHPFVVQKNTSLARHISANQLKTLLDNVLDLDVRMKTTSIDADEALTALLIEISSRE